MNESVNKNPTAEPFLITVEKVTKSFGKKTLFRNFTYNFPSTGIFVLTGESGKGKTTLLRMISGLDKKYSGKLTVTGSVSYMFQEYRLFPTLTALDNVLLPAFKEATEEDRTDALKLLSELKLSEEEAMQYPSELSGGMKQRISFARALLYKSDILLLDEATKELDSELREKVLSIIKREAESRLVILVTHNTADIEAVGATEIRI